jgi:hypothetical protein
VLLGASADAGVSISWAGHGATGMFSVKSAATGMDAAYRKYQRTAAVITWGGNRKPAKTGAVGRVVTGPVLAVRDRPGQQCPC